VRSGALRLPAETGIGRSRRRHLAAEHQRRVHRTRARSWRVRNRSSDSDLWAAADSRRAVGDSIAITVRPLPSLRSLPPLRRFAIARFAALKSTDDDAIVVVDERDER